MVLAVLCRNIEKSIFGNGMLGICILNRVCPFIVGWTFGAATLGGGADAGALCGRNVGACLLGVTCSLAVEIGSGLS